MGISLQDAGLDLSTSNTRGEVSGYFNIVPLLSPRRRTLNSEQRRRGIRCLSTCYSYRNCHSSSLPSGTNYDLLQLPKLSLFKSAIRNKLRPATATETVTLQVCHQEQITTCYSYRNCHSSSLPPGINYDLLQLPKLLLFKAAIRNKLLADDQTFFN